MQVIEARKVLGPDGWIDNAKIVIQTDGTIAEAKANATLAMSAVDVLLPAPGNLHSHTFQRAMAGLTEGKGQDARDSFWTWRSLMYRFLDQLTPDHIEAIAALAFMEMLETGFGAVAEFHYLHHGPDGRPYDNVAEMAERVVAAAEKTGIGLTLLPVLYMQGGCDGRSLVSGQQRFGCDLGLYERLHAASHNAVRAGYSDYETGYAPHSLRAVSPAALKDLFEHSAGSPFHIHIAEQVAEVDEVKAAYNARPIEWLLANAEVDERCCLIHCTHMTAEETRGLAASAAVAGLCPITEANLGDGHFDGVAYQKAGGRYGVGSDSNVSISLFGELATLEYGQRLRDRTRAALATPTRSTGRVLFEAAAASGAQALGRKSGRIEAGYVADLVAVGTDNPHLCGHGNDQILDGLIFSGQGQSCISDVWSAGRHVVRQGCHVQRTEIVNDYMRTLKSLQTSL